MRDHGPWESLRLYLCDLVPLTEVHIRNPLPSVNLFQQVHHLGPDGHSVLPLFSWNTGHNIDWHKKQNERPKEDEGDSGCWDRAELIFCRYELFYSIRCRGCCGQVRIPADSCPWVDINIRLGTLPNSINRDHAWFLELLMHVSFLSSSPLDC